jgi:RNA polymerase sigma factor (sigma-70 family)
MNSASMREQPAHDIGPATGADADLVRAAQAGDVQAFSTLVEKNQAMARAIAFSVSSDYSITEDLAQEAMVTAWLRLSDLSEPGKFRPWLAAIVRNTAHYWRRHQGRHAPRAQYGIDVLELLPDNSSSPLDRALINEDQGHAKSALEGLPERYKEPLLLYYCLGESHAEVASALGVSEAAVRQRLCRARKKLKQGVESLEQSGSRLRTQVSAAAAVLLVIQSRQAWAHTAARVGSQSALASPKLFMGLGALAGGALVACIAAVVFVLGGGDPSATPAPKTKAASPIKSAPAAELSPADHAAPARPGGLAEPASIDDSRALVRIGNGKVKDKGDESTATAEGGRRLASANNDAQLKSESDSKAVSKGGRIHKHGPARLHEDAASAAPVAKPMLKPSLDMKAVQRELWSED